MEGLNPATTYYVAVTSVDRGGDESWYSRERSAETGGAVAVPAESLPGLATALVGNSPNPFGTTTRIFYSTAGPNRVLIEVYDVNGRHVTTLLNEQRPGGLNHVTWNALDQAGHRVPPGLYLLSFRAGKVTETRKALYLP